MRDGRGREISAPMTIFKADANKEPYRVPVPSGLKAWMESIAKTFTPSSTTQANRDDNNLATRTFNFTGATLPTSWGAGALTLNSLTVRADARVTLDLSGELTDVMEENLEIHIYALQSTRSRKAIISGPNAAASTAKDATEPYQWTANITYEDWGPLGLAQDVGPTGWKIMFVDDGARRGTDIILFDGANRNPNDPLNPWVRGGVEKIGLRPFVEKQVATGQTNAGKVQFSDFIIYDNANKPDWIELSLTDTAQQLTMLSNAEAYEVQAAAITAIGQTAFAASDPVLTIPRKPNAPEASGVQLATSRDSLSVQWETTIDELAEYNVQISQAAETGGQVGLQTTEPAYTDVVTGFRGSGYIVPNLLPGLEAQVRVRASNPGGATAGTPLSVRVGYAEDGLRLPEDWFDYPPQGAHQLWSTRQDLITNTRIAAMFYRYERVNRVEGEVDDRDLREVGEWKAGSDYRDGDVAYTRVQRDIVTGATGSGGRVLTFTTTKKWVCIRPHNNAPASTVPSAVNNPYWRQYDPGTEIDVSDIEDAVDVTDPTENHGLTGKTITMSRVMPALEGETYQPNSQGEISIGSLHNGVFERLGPAWNTALGANLLVFSFFDATGNDNTFFHDNVRGAVEQGVTVEVAIVDGQRWIKYEVQGVWVSANRNRCAMAVAPSRYNDRGNISDIGNDMDLVFSLTEQVGANITSTRTQRRYRTSATTPSAVPADEGVAVEDHVPIGWSTERGNPDTLRNVYQIARTATYMGNTFQSATSWGAPTIIENKIDAPLPSTDTIYLLAAAKPATPTGGGNDEDHVPAGGWTRTRPDATTTQSVWQSQRTISRTDRRFVSASAWGEPSLNQEKLSTATRVVQRYIFIFLNNKPSTPGGTSATLPNGWTDGGTSDLVPETLRSRDPVWRSQRDETVLIATNEVQSRGNWSEPINAFAPTPTLTQSQGAFTINWPALYFPSNVQRVEASYQTGGTGSAASWGTATAWATVTAGSEIYTTSTDDEWVRVRIRPVVAGTALGASNYSDGLQANIVTATVSIPNQTVIVGHDVNTALQGRINPNPLPAIPGAATHSLSGGLPQGLSFSSSTRRINGRVRLLAFTDSRNSGIGWLIQYNGYDAQGNLVGTASFRIKVIRINSLHWTIPPALNTEVDVGSGGTFTPFTLCEAVDGDGVLASSYTFTPLNAGVPGMVISSLNARVSGTLTVTSGTYAYSVTARSNGSTVIDTNTAAGGLVGPKRIRVSSSVFSLPMFRDPYDFTVGELSQYFISPTGGARPYNITVTGLPSSITWDGSSISGTAVAADLDNGATRTYTCTFRAVDANGSVITGTFTVRVNPASG